MSSWHSRDIARMRDLASRRSKWKKKQQSALFSLSLHPSSFSFRNSFLFLFFFGRPLFLESSSEYIRSSLWEIYLGHLNSGAVLCLLLLPSLSPLPLPPPQTLNFAFRPPLSPLLLLPTSRPALCGSRGCRGCFSQRRRRSAFLKPIRATNKGGRGPRHSQFRWRKRGINFTN